MALTTKRIIALPSQTDPQEGDYLAIDNATSGTHKIPVGRIGVEVDDTLTEAGKAADAKAVGDALDEIRSQAEATDDSIDEIRSQIEVAGTASGAIATFTDGADMPAKSVVVNIVPKQSGTGTPSPENVRPISGWESVDVNVTGVNVWDEELQGGYWDTSTGDFVVAGNWQGCKNYIPIDASKTYFMYGDASVTGSYGARLFYDKNKNYLGFQNGAKNTTFTPIANACYMTFYISNNYIGKEVSINYPSTDHDYHAYNGQTITKDLGQTVYGCEVDIVSGVLTSYPFYPSYNGETLNGRWICDRAVYAEGTTPPTGSQVALVSGTGTTYTLTPTEIQTLLGENNVWADSGDVEVVYVRDLNIAINNLLNSNGTRSLGMMAMSAPTEATAEEPTGEQTEEPAEDDMR